MTKEASLVLVADNDPSMCLLAQKALQQDDLAVEVAPDGKQALSAFRRLRPDIVLLDVNLPEMDGFATCAELRKLPEAARTPVLMLTEYDDLESIHRSYDVGATDFVAKPVNWVIVSEHIRYMLRASNLAYYDSLTGLPNRVLFKALLTQALAFSQRHKEIMGILLLDFEQQFIDRLRNVNGTFDHSQHDRLLKGVATRLAENIREITRPDEAPDKAPDLIARFGEDALTILLTGLHNAEDVTRVAKRFFQELSRPFILDQQEVFVTGRMGISVYPFDGKDAGALLRNAAAAIYQANGQHKNGYHFYSASMNANSLVRVSLESDLRKAVKRKEFVVYYQPKVEAQTRKIVGAEAVVRWIHPLKGVVPPSEFISLAKETGLIIPIGEQVLHRACLQMTAWRQAGYAPIHVAIRLSSLQFLQKDLVKTISRTLQASQLNPEYLELEITESALMHNEEAASLTLTSLRTMGVSIVIDNYGTDFSSLSYLKRFPVNALRIDRSFVKDIANDPDVDAITTAIILMAKSFQLTVIAEGVETEEQRKFLQEQGCDEMQGYLFSPPVPADKFVKLMHVVA